MTQRDRARMTLQAKGPCRCITIAAAAAPQLKKERSLTYFAIIINYGRGRLVSQVTHRLMRQGGNSLAWLVTHRAAA